MAPSTGRFTFPGQDGQTLAGRLDQPGGKPRAFAIFAHCFACSKDSLAATRISAALAAHGVAVLRFDFTGLGGSEGEFGDAGFAANLEDVIAAARFLDETFEAPSLLIGHSLGGAAVLAAAEHLPSVRGVVTLGAPSDPEHTLRHLGDGSRAAREEGSAEVRLGGHSYRVSRRFVEDFERQGVLERVGRLRRALLVLHAPKDDVVGVEHAAAIFNAAKHPKSFVSLDDADHLLTRRADAQYAAGVIAAWATRYIPSVASEPAEAPEPDERRIVAGETGEGRYQLSVAIGTHRMLMDEPARLGGDDSGPTPFELLSAALAGCTSITLRMYAERKGLPLERVETEVAHLGKHAVACADCVEGGEALLDHFKRTVRLEGPLDAGQRQKLMEIAGKCPVHRTLEAGAHVVTELE